MQHHHPSACIATVCGSWPSEACMLCGLGSQVMPQGPPQPITSHLDVAVHARPGCVSHVYGRVGFTALAALNATALAAGARWGSLRSIQKSHVATLLCVGQGSMQRVQGR